jgi:hypothetical protein
MFFLSAILSALKEKPPEINDFRGSVVAGVVLPGLRPSECHVGGALLMKAFVRFAHNCLFYRYPYECKLSMCTNKKARIVDPGFL